MTTTDEPEDEPQMMRLFGVDETDRLDRGPHRPGDLRYRRAAIPAEALRRQVGDFLESMRTVLGHVSTTIGGYELDQVQISAEISAQGHVSLLGAGGELAGKGGLVFTFKRPAAKPEAAPKPPVVSE
jgi:hypothetical protein